MTIIREGQVWEDEEGYQWKVLENTSHNEHKCQCVYKPKKRGLIGRYKEGESITWESDGENSAIFYKLLAESGGAVLPTSEPEQREFKAGDLDGKGDTKESDAYFCKKKGQGEGEQEEESPKQHEDPEVDIFLLEILNLNGDEWENSKIAFNEFTRAQLKREKFLKSAKKGEVLTSEYGLDRRIKKSVQLNYQDLADINKEIKAENKKNQTDKSELEIRPSQLWASEFKKDVLKIIYVEGDTVFAIRVKDTEGNTPKYCMPMQTRQQGLKNHFKLLEDTSEVTSQELKQFRGLEERANKLAQQESKSVTSADDENPILKRLNQAYAETLAATRFLVNLRAKILNK